MGQLDRTFPSDYPTVGLSPIDSYMTKPNLPAAYFEVAYPSVASYSVTAVAVYAKIALYGDKRTIGGYTAVIQARLEVGAGSAGQTLMSCLCLDFSNVSSNPISNFIAAYIALRDRSATAGTDQMNNLFYFQDIDPSSAARDVLFCSSTDTASTHRIRIKSKAGTYYWIMVTSTEPA